MNMFVFSKIIDAMWESIYFEDSFEVPDDFVNYLSW